MAKPCVICLKCKWYVSFAVTRKHAEAEVKRFNKYFNKLTKEEQISHYGGTNSSIDRYEGCSFCGGTEFRLATDDEIPNGSTIGPVIWEKPKS